MTRSQFGIRSIARRWLVVPLSAVVAGLAGGGVAQAVPLFSIGDLASVSGSDSTIFAPGPIGGPPTPFIFEAALGIAVPGVVDLDAMSFGAPAIDLFFSVDRPDIGIPGAAPDVFSEAAVGQAHADIYSTVLGGTNSLSVNQDLLGLLPAIPPGVPAFPPSDNLDALDLDQSGPIPGPGPPAVLFSLIAGNVFGFSGADVLGIGPGIVVPAAGLGLVFADDLDALHFDPSTGLYYFSLSPGSPSLAGACGGLSPADIFVSAGGGACGLFAPAAALGLLATDNVDAIAFVPEPSTAILLGAGLAAALAATRRARTFRGSPA